MLYHCVYRACCMVILFGSVQSCVFPLINSDNINETCSITTEQKRVWYNGPTNNGLHP